MIKAGKTYTTFNKTRLVLFTQTYVHEAITNYLITKYEINNKLKPREMRKKFFRKNAIPEISKLAKTLHFNYRLLWEAIVLSKHQAIDQKIKDKEKINLFLSIESELISLAKAKRKKSDYTDPDYEDDFGMLTTAIERSIGNALQDIEDDFLFVRQSEELKQNYRYWYYRIAYRYKLPTIRIVPFIMRLIT